MKLHVKRKVTIFSGIFCIQVFIVVLVSYILLDIRDRLEVLENYNEIYTAKKELHQVIYECEKLKSKYARNTCQLTLTVK